MIDDSAPASSPASARPPGPPRRTFIVRLVALLAALPPIARYLVWPSAARARESRAAPTAQPNATLLAALGAAVLPAELGTDGTKRAVTDFQRWMDGYRPGAEANHGYGTGNIQRLPADPRPRWRTQLSALDEQARRAHGQAFTSLSRADRQAIVRSALSSERGESLPNPLMASHIALALIAHFYESPAATDLGYEARIGRQQCRPLGAAPEQPVPLTRGGR
jgi:hypothetical protein